MRDDVAHDDVVGRLAAHRDAALVRAQMLAVQGHELEAAGLLAEAVSDAPPGFAGWTVPVEPFLLQIADRTVFAPVFSRLADRAR